MGTDAQQYCRHKDKVCLTKQEAMDRCRQMSIGGQPMDKYHCKQCGFWHLAHRMSRANRQALRYKAAKKR